MIHSKKIDDQEWCEDNVIFVCQTWFYSAGLYKNIYIYFVSNLENSCNVYHLFLQYGYDQYTYPHSKRKQFSQTQNIDN